MRVLRLLLFFVALAAVDSPALAQEADSADLRRATFEAAWTTIDRAFFDPDHLGVDWANVGARYRARLAELRDDADLARLLNAMAAELGVSHLDVLTDAPRPSSGVAGEGSPLEWAPHPERSGLLVARVRSFDGLTPERIDALLGDLAGIDGLILDLRGNEGGDISFLELAGRFLDGQATVGGIVTRAWLEAHDHPLDEKVPLDLLPKMGPPFALDRLLAILGSGGGVAFVTGGVDPAYPGCVAVLVDRRTGSAAEAFAMTMDRAKTATLVGEPTAGALLSSEVFPLPNGWRLRVPVAVGMDESGRIFWDRVVEPDVRVEPGEEAMEAALSALDRCLDARQARRASPSEHLIEAR